MKVLIIPEDHRLDRHILKPIVERLFTDLGRNARVDLEDSVRGVDQALDQAKLSEIIDRNPMIGLFLLIVDRDCEDRQPKVAAREAEHRNLIGCLAIEELEVWMLALHRDDLGAAWTTVRAECHPKERYAEPFLRARNWFSGAGRGRLRAMRDLGSKWSGLQVVCPEIAELRGKIQRFLATP